MPTESFGNEMLDAVAGGRDALSGAADLSAWSVLFGQRSVVILEPSEAISAEA